MYYACGGSVAAPCLCIYTDERRYQCNTCSVFCKERSDWDINKQLAEGLDLDDVRVRTSSKPRYPILIPLDTKVATQQLPLAVAGIELESLFNNAKTKPLSPKRFLTKDEPINMHLRLPPKTRMIAVMNGKDSLLEAFWATKRSEVYKLLMENGISTLTCPTFSVVFEENGFPASHNTCMQRRHHRVFSELQSVSIDAIPNVYWRNDEELMKWADWLNRNCTVSTISRDFSRTKQRSFLPLLEKLVAMLEKVDHRLHVLLVGMGPRNGVVAIKALSQIGYTASVVTSFASKEATIKGKRLEVTRSGKLISWQDLPVPKRDLVFGNIKALEEYLVREALKLDVYKISDLSLFNWQIQTKELNKTGLVTRQTSQ